MTEISSERLTETFKTLVEIDSVSKSELAVSKVIQKLLAPLDASFFIDDAGEKFGANTGNLIAKIHGDIQNQPVMFNAHMDTVEPGKGVTAVFKDGIFTSDGSTILGGDDKSAIAILIEVMRVLKENSIPHCPIELVFTISEEIGLLGAKHIDLSMITSKFGYALDSKNTDSIVTQAPAANRLEFKIHGKDAHAGAAPEKGINAISIAGKAIADLTLGRIDHETTCNIGIIQGGIATNIVPSLVTVKGEVRSHKKEKLDSVTSRIVNSFETAVGNTPPLPDDGGISKLDVSVEEDFPLFNIPDNHPVVVLAQKAAQNIERTLSPVQSGGGSDANIFCRNGITTTVLGTGMSDIHTVRESIRLEDMVDTAQLVLEIIKLHSQGH